MLGGIVAAGTRTHDDSLGLSGAALDASREPDVERVQALLESRFLGTPLVSTKIGRFVVLDRIGAGAMGAVYSAYDAQLDRRVALKVLHARREADEHERRLVREAQAMARLSHPNVVTIHDVGEHADRLYLAMELVEGVTLRRWLQADARTWREIVAVFVQAGRGLAAAHEAGLVHRDFKPDNLLVDRRGRAKVADFGLAHTGTGEPSGADASASASGSSDASSDRLTRSGTIVGTPAYMSPEQAGGEEPGPADDQFSFCVALYEALYGVRPFAGTRLVELVANVRTGTFAETSRGDAVPPRIRAIVRRGLAFHRADRWPSLGALVDALERDPTRGRRRWLAASALVALVAVGSGAYFVLRHRALQRCDDAEAQTRALWNDDARERTRTSFERTALPFAAATWELADPIAGAAVDALAVAHGDACRARELGPRFDDEQAHAVDECLAEHDARLAALVELWSDADQRILERAVSAATQLPEPSRCLDPEWLRDRPAPPDVETRDAVQAVRLRLAHASALQRSGRSSDAADVTRAALEEADAIGYEPVRAEALRALGQCESNLGHPREALTLLRSAFVAATRSRHDEMAAEAAVSSVFSAQMAGELDAADEWAEVAEAVLDRTGQLETPLHAVLLGFRGSVAARRTRLDDAARLFAEADAMLARIEPDPNSLARSSILENWGLADASRGAYDDAEAHHREAYEINLARLGPGHPDVALSLNNLGLVQMHRGDFPGAARLYEESIALTERASGPNAPRLFAALDNLGLAESRMGHLDAALRLHTRALVIGEASLGRDHLDIATTLTNISLVQAAKDDYPASDETLHRALAILEAHGLGESAQAAALIDNLGLVAVATGDLDLAIQRHESSLAMRQRVLGPDHADLTWSLSNLGEAELRAGRHDDAIEHSMRAIEVAEATVGRDHFVIAFPLCVQAEARIEQGRLAEAEPLAARAVEIRTKARMSPPDIATARVLLARALRGRDDARAEEELARARQECGSAEARATSTCRQLAPHLGP